MKKALTIIGVVVSVANVIIVAVTGYGVWLIIKNKRATEIFQNYLNDICKVI